MITPQRQLHAVAKTLTRLAGGTIDRTVATALQLHAEALAKLAEDITPVWRRDMLTPAQASVLSFIRQRMSKDGEAPTRKEICEQFNFASHNSAQEHIRALERKGHITLTGGARGIRLNKRTTIGNNNELHAN